MKAGIAIFNHSLLLALSTQNLPNINKSSLCKTVGHDVNEQSTLFLQERAVFLCPLGRSIRSYNDDHPTGSAKHQDMQAKD